MKLSVEWLKDFVKLSPPLEKIAEQLTLAGLEVKKIEPTPGDKDTLFEVEITSNRPDWLSHLGVAREISAVEGLSLKLPQVDKAANRPMPAGWKINLKELEACPYYTGVYIEGIQNNPTPDFIRDRLATCGVRSIHLIVDITNYVLLEMGQPLHAFDADLLAGQEIQIRKAKPEEKLTAINGGVLVLGNNDLVIADRDKSTALAGIMGGKDTEVTSRTRNIFLESAFFSPRWVRQSSRRLGISSDSSYRFERRVDPEGVDLGRERAISLIQQYAKPRFISAVIKAGQKPAAAKSVVHLTGAEIEKRLGVKIKTPTVSSILTRLGFDVKPDSQESWKVGIPSFRADVISPVDLIEEVARIHGFENIPETLPSRAPILGKQDLLTKVEDKARAFFPGSGCFETVTFSLIAAQSAAEEEMKRAVYVSNPQNKDLCWMRPYFLPSLLGVIQKNISWGAKSVSLFEVANLYNTPEKGQGHPEESVSLGVALYGKSREKNWADTERDYSFYDLKGHLIEFLNSLWLPAPVFKAVKKSYLVPGAEEIFIEKESIGFLGEVSTRVLKSSGIEESVFFAQINLEKLPAFLGGKKQIAEILRYPAIERDIAVTVPETVQASEIEAEIRQQEKTLIAQVQAFDLFRGGRIPKGYKSLAFRIVYQSREKTLLSEEIQKLHGKIAENIVKKFQATFQS